MIFLRCDKQIPLEDCGSNLDWCGLRLGKNWWEYCNKQALICNKLRTVSKIGGDTGTFKKNLSR